MSDYPVYAFLADAVLMLHAAVVVFVVGGFFLILIGNWFKWRQVNMFWFRLLHLVAIAVVVAGSWLGAACPLTQLEMWLRTQAHKTTYNSGFIEYWLQQLLYYQAPGWVFSVTYTLFGLMVLALWWYYPPVFGRGTDKNINVKK